VFWGIIYATGLTLSPMKPSVDGTKLHLVTSLPSLDKQSPVITIDCSLVGGCGLSHEHVENGCKSTCVKLVVWGNGKFNASLGYLPT